MFSSFEVSALKNNNDKTQEITIAILWRNLSKWSTANTDNKVAILPIRYVRYLKFNLLNIASELIALTYKLMLLIEQTEKNINIIFHASKYGSIAGFIKNDIIRFCCYFRFLFSKPVWIITRRTIPGDSSILKPASNE